MRSIETYSFEQKYRRGKNPSKVNEKRNSACVAKSEGHSVSLSTQLKWNFSETDTVRTLRSIAFMDASTAESMRMHNLIERTRSNYTTSLRSIEWLITCNLAKDSHRDHIESKLTHERNFPIFNAVFVVEKTRTRFIYPHWWWILIVGHLSGIMQKPLIPDIENIIEYMGKSYTITNISIPICTDSSTDYIFYDDYLCDCTYLFSNDKCRWNRCKVLR